MPDTEKFDVFLYDYNGDADQDLGDYDVMVLEVCAATPERALEIAKHTGPPEDIDKGEGQEFAGYVEMDEVPKDALTIGAPGALALKKMKA